MSDYADLEESECNGMTVFCVLCGDPIATNWLMQFPQTQICEECLADTLDPRMEDYGL